MREELLLFRRDLALNCQMTKPVIIRNKGIMPMMKLAIFIGSPPSRRVQAFFPGAIECHWGIVSLGSYRPKYMGGTRININI
ncbi:hypothetical protein SAMN04487897_102427 [Paenibacillus sp. yr247]|nr:hypothetical protein SAMN04487897_102427 [Paenibacillus sp. yr247]